MYYLLRSQTKQGVKSLDLVDAQSYEKLLERLEKQEVTPLGITQLPEFLSPVFLFGKKRVSEEEVIEMVEDLHLIFKSGLPLHQGILDLAQDSENKQFKNMVYHIAEDLEMGNSLSSALEVYKESVGDMVLNLTKIGEASGQLELTLQRGASFLRRTLTLKKRVKSALIYPSFAFAAVLGSMLVWMLYVLPQMIQLFKEMDIELPTLTVIIINTSEFLSNYIAYIAVALIILGILFKFLYKRYKSFRWQTDKLILKVPIISQIIGSFNMAFIAEYLRLALVSGVPLLSALETLSKNVKNELYQQALIDISDEVLKGNQLSAAFASTNLFTPFTIRMINIGESAGTLDSQLNLVSEFYYEKVDYYAENIGKIIEPVVLIIVGGFMAVIMLGLMGPIYDFVAAIK